MTVPSKFFPPRDLPIPEMRNARCELPGPSTSRFINSVWKFEPQSNGKSHSDNEFCVESNRCSNATMRRRERRNFRILRISFLYKDLSRETFLLVFPPSLFTVPLSLCRYKYARTKVQYTYGIQMLATLSLFMYFEKHTIYCNIRE